MSHLAYKKQSKWCTWTITATTSSDWPSCNTTNRWCSIDAHLQDGAGSISLPLFLIMAANISFMAVCNILPTRLPKIHDQQSLMLCWRSFRGWGSEHVWDHVDHSGSQYIEKDSYVPKSIFWDSQQLIWMWQYILKPETQNWALKPTGLAKASNTSRLMGTGSGLACPEAAGQVFGWVCNWTNLILRSKPGPLTGYPDPVLTLSIRRHARSSSYMQRSTCNHENEGKTDNLGWMLYWVYAVLGVCCTWCMLYLVYTSHGVCCTQC